MDFDYGIYIFRKDLRIEDNRGLIKLQKKCKEIIPIFIFDPYQVKKSSKNKTYLAFRALRFLCESVEDLHNKITKEKSKLYIFNDDPNDIIEYIITKLKKDYSDKKICLGFNEDFTEYSLKRDKLIKEISSKLKISVISNDDDYTLCDMKILTKNTNLEPYKQYGAFRKNMLDNKNKFNKVDHKKIIFHKQKIVFKNTLDHTKLSKFWKNNIEDYYNPLEIGQRELGSKILSELKKFKEYDTKRDILSYNTTHLSAYLNFGLISEREFFEAAKNKLGENCQLVSQIIWRNYYLCLLRYLEKANSYVNHIDSRYDKLKWTKEFDKNSKATKEWLIMMNSQTGFLLIDAALEEIKTTGYMHNRCRMMVGVFSVKYLKINPLCRYIGLNDWFSRYLLDCSASQNKLNGQWVTELDFPGKKFSPHNAVLAGRPMSIHNEMIKKWDPTCEYIKKWLPHLKDVDNKILYKWDTKFDEKIHPKPIFNPRERYAEWISLCEI
jgi:deoxyribodipyrimidine photo-lyase